MDENYNKNFYENDESSEAETHSEETSQVATVSEENVSDCTQNIQASQDAQETENSTQDAQMSVPEQTANAYSTQQTANAYGTQQENAYSTQQTANAYGTQQENAYSTQQTANAYGTQQENAYSTQQTANAYGTQQENAYSTQQTANAYGTQQENAYSTQQTANAYGAQQTTNAYGQQQAANAYGSQQYGRTSYGATNQNPYQQYGNPYQQFQSTGSYGQQTQNSQSAGYGQQTSNGQTAQYGQQQTPPPSNTPKPPKKERKKGGTGTFIGKVVAAALIFGLIGGGVFTGISYVGTNALGITASNDDNKNSDSSSGTSSDSASDSSSNDTVSTTDTSATATDLTDVSGVVEEVMPSIVAITNISTTTYSSMFGGTETYETTSLGSGIIIDQDDEYLYICTNNHVVSGSESLTVQFVDDSTVSAEITGTDSSDDLAVIQVALSSIEADTLEQIKVAAVDDSGDVKVGEAVIAIGNALGYGQSVTTGVVSATGRTVSVTDSTTGTTVTNTNLIQTDAAINSGNSGGALLNANGEVIGINAAKYSATGVEGIGYAIPMSDAYSIIEALINGEDIPQSAYLGISGQTISSDVASQYNVPIGVLVVEVIEGTAAEEAGIQAGDIITAIDGQELESMDDLKTYLAGLKEGDQVTITLSRQSNNYSYKEMEVEVTLGGQSTTSE